MTESEIHTLESELYLLFVRGEISQDQMYEKINDILEGNQ